MADLHEQTRVMEDWKYDMRREMQAITQSLYLGPNQAARDKALLQAHGITHLLCIRDRNEAHWMRALHAEFVYHFIEVSDSLTDNLIPHFPGARAFIQYALSTPANKILVYCNNGLSRSPCFVIAYLMETCKWSFVTAYEYVQNRRFCISPNENFKVQLKEYQFIYEARGMEIPATGNEARFTSHLKRRQRQEDSDEIGFGLPA